MCTSLKNNFGIRPHAIMGRLRIRKCERLWLSSTVLLGGNMISAYRALPKGLRFFLCYGLMPLWLIPAIIGCALFILVGSLVVEAKSAWENYK